MLLSATENCCLHLLVQDPSVLLSREVLKMLSILLYQFKQVFHSKSWKNDPTSYHIYLPFFPLLHYFPLPSAPTSLRLADGAPPAHGSSSSLQQYLLNFLGSYLGAPSFPFKDLAGHSLGSHCSTISLPCTLVKTILWTPWLGLHSWKRTGRHKALWCLWGSIT